MIKMMRDNSGGGRDRENMTIFNRVVSESKIYLTVFL